MGPAKRPRPNEPGGWWRKESPPSTSGTVVAPRPSPGLRPPSPAPAGEGFALSPGRGGNCFRVLIVRMRWICFGSGVQCANGSGNSHPGPFQLSDTVALRRRGKGAGSGERRAGASARGEHLYADLIPLAWPRCCDWLSAQSRSGGGAAHSSYGSTTGSWCDARPHPGPLLRGEGEGFAAFSKNTRLDWTRYGGGERGRGAGSGGRGLQLVENTCTQI